MNNQPHDDLCIILDSYVKPWTPCNHTHNPNLAKPTSYSWPPKIFLSFFTNTSDENIPKNQAVKSNPLFSWTVVNETSPRKEPLGEPCEEGLKEMMNLSEESEDSDYMTDSGNDDNELLDLGVFTRW